MKTLSEGVPAAPMNDPSRPTMVASPAVSGQSLGLWRLVVLALLMGFGAIATDLYLPALPSMAAALHANSGTVAFTIGAYLIGFSSGQLIWGPIGDRFGRRIPIAIGLVAFCIGSAGCALSSTVGTMIAWRIIQALGACSGVVLARAIVRDVYAPARAAQTLSTLITIMAIAPLIAPLLGGQILTFASWHVIFWLMVAVGIATLAALFTLPETLPAQVQKPGALRAAFAGYADVVRDPKVLANAFTGGLFYVGIYAYISGTPSAYITYYHVPQNLYGLLFGASILGIMGMNMLNVRLVTRLGSTKILRYGAISAALAGIASAAVSLTGFGGLAGLVVPLLLYCAMSGLIVANSIAGAMAGQPERAGTTSAFVGALHYGIGMAGSGLVALFADGTPRPLGCVVALAGIGCFVLSRFLKSNSNSIAR